jgi:branched-chain amino acid transport system ATP-binding protein
MNHTFVVKGLCKSFGGLTAVEDFDLSLPSSDLVTFIIGPNGAGKTTVVNMLAGSLTPDRGTIMLEGRDITRMSLIQRVHTGIARTFQQTGVFSRLTPREHLILSTKQKQPSVTDPLLDAFSLSAVADTPVSELNHVSQRLLEICMIVSMKPKVIMLDEPTAGMDSTEVDQVAQAINRIRESRTIIVVEHDMEFVFRLADQIIVLDTGRTIASGSPEEIQSDKGVHESYVGGLTI